MTIKDNVIITDPCYVVKDEDWVKCEYGERLDKLGFTNYISESTIYGDWSCTTFAMPIEDLKDVIDNPDSIEGKEYSAIGNFCADAGMVCVLSMSEVIKYNPEFPKWIETHPRCVTMVPGFDGVIDYYVDSNKEAHIYGIGNVNFYTTQTGF